LERAGAFSAFGLAFGRGFGAGRRGGLALVFFLVFTDGIAASPEERGRADGGSRSWSCGLAVRQ
jgi:hypothetical protein